jgi:hypothetical protein
LRVRLRDICGTRAGDKGDISNVALFAYSDAGYRAIVDAVTVDRVKDHFGSMVRGTVTRHEVPNVLALNFVMRGALGGGGPRSLRADNLGKAMGAHLLRLEVEVPDELRAELRPQAPRPG